MPDDPIDSQAWTGGLNPEDASPASSSARGKRSRSNLARVISSVALGATAVIVFFVNYHGIKHETGPATVSWVRFNPAHWGAKQWVPNKWIVHFSLDKEDGDLVLDGPPIDWLTAKKNIVVTYGRGRIYNDIVVEDVKPAPSLAY